MLFRRVIDNRNKGLMAEIILLSAEVQFGKIVIMAGRQTWPNEVITWVSNFIESRYKLSQETSMEMFLGELDIRMEMMLHTDQIEARYGKEA